MGQIVKLRNLLFVVDVLFIAFMTYIVGKLIDAWTAYAVPPGGDTLNALQKVRWILDFWPNVTWSYQWGGGMPLIRWYPPAFGYIVAVLVLISGTSIELATVYMLYLLYLIGFLAIYAFTLKLTGSRMIGLLAAVLALISPSVWDFYVIGGVLSRVGALLMLPIALWLVLVQSNASISRRWTRLSYAALVLALALSILFNPLMGVPITAMALLSILFLEDDVRRQIGRVVKLAVAVLFVAAFFLFPFYFRTPTYLGLETWGFGVSRNYFDLSRFPAIEPSYLALSPMVVALLISVLILPRFVKTPDLPKLQKRAYRFLVFIAAVICLGMIIEIFDASIVGDVALGVVALPFILAPIAAIKYCQIIGRVTKYSTYVTALVIIGLIGSMIVISGVPVTKVVSTDVIPDQSAAVLNQLSLRGGDSMQYRIAVRGTEGFIGQWWNYRSNVPQTHNYFDQGMLYPDWTAWLNDAVWKDKNNYYETNFLLDWWAVKWILVNTANSDPSKFLSRPDSYSMAANISIPPALYEFEYNSPRPILSASNSPTLLVIGRDEYRAIMNDLSYYGYSDSQVIPVHGSPYIDDYSIDQLRQYDSILLYGYDFHDRTTAWNLVRQYVEQGGGLVIDTGFSPDSNSTTIPLPSPVTNTNFTNFGSQWHFTWINSSVTNGVDFGQFSPPVSGGNPWRFSSSYNASVLGWAKPVLWDAGQPALVLGNYGKGRVAWSGLNLPYHAGTYKNYEETKLLANMIGWSVGQGYPMPASEGYVAHQDNPEQMSVLLNGAVHGVLLKEFYYVDWKATIVTPNGLEQIPILPVGPDFMYVMVPSGMSYPTYVTFRFDNTVDYVGQLISAVSLMFLAGYVLIGPRALFFIGPLASGLASIRRREQEWWSRDV